MARGHGAVYAKGCFGCVCIYLYFVLLGTGGAPCALIFGVLLLLGGFHALSHSKAGDGCFGVSVGVVLIVMAFDLWRKR